MRTSLLRPFLLTAALAVFSGLAHGQESPGWTDCLDPSVGVSVDYAVGHIGEAYGDDTPLFQVSLGEAGSAGMLGGTPCTDQNPQVPYKAIMAGRFGFGSGRQGSVQSQTDDDMVYTFGMPDFPGNSFGYAMVTEDGTLLDQPTNKVLYGNSPWEEYFKGESNRYIISEQSLQDSDVTLTIEVLGDSSRFDWIIKNASAANHTFGLWTGCWIALKEANGDYRGAIAPEGTKRIFYTVPNQRPSNLETRWTRSANPSVYPPYIDFDWSQTEPYGLRVDTGPTPSTTDPVSGQSDATQSDEIELGNHQIMLGTANEATPKFPDGHFPYVHNEPGVERSDILFIDNPAYIKKYAQTPLAPGATREIVEYYRDTWGQSNYSPPYTVVIDAPEVFNYDPNGVNQLVPNPATFRVWIDNIVGFSTAEQLVPLENVQITLDLTQSPGLTFVGGGKKKTLTISRIDAKHIASVDFSVQADGVATGVQPFTVTVQAPPGPTKVIQGTTDISTTPKIPVIPGANLVTLPWTFSDSSWTAILGLSEPTQFQAFDWDPVQQTYVLSTSAQRGKGTWLVIEDPSVIPQGIVPLASNPALPTDMVQGTDVLQLKSGWNLIGDPYPYPIPLGEIVGVSAGNPTTTFSWNDLVNAGLVSGALAYWDTTSNPAGYKFITGNDALMQPNVGYWLFVQDTGLTLEFPPVFMEGANAPAQSLTAVRKSLVATPWTQTDAQWRLMISARTNNEIDDQNYIGKAANVKAAELGKIYEPPMSPSQKLGVSIGSDKPGGPALAQSLVATTGVSQWKVYVQTKAKNSGEVTLTWPNMSSVPKNVAFRITDESTGTSRDMRQTSGYTFTAPTNVDATRTFTVTAQPGVASHAVIGNVVVSQAGRGRDRNAPFTISYTLSSNATTTVRILGAGGREVYTATRGRADVAGENTATWALRDNANRAVAPGIYRVEITAETTDGERVRKIVPINVIR